MRGNTQLVGRVGAAASGGVGLGEPHPASLRARDDVLSDVAVVAPGDRSEHVPVEVGAVAVPVGRRAQAEVRVVHFDRKPAVLATPGHLELLVEGLGALLDPALRWTNLVQ